MKKRKPQGHNSQKRKRKSGRKVFPQLVGKVQMTREGFAFVVVDGEQEDIFVNMHKTRGALNGDTVRVAVIRDTHDYRPHSKSMPSGQKGHRREGEIVEIIERSDRPFVGVYHTIGANAWVLMQSRFMPYDIQVDPEKAAEMGAKPGWKVSVLVDRWNRGEAYPSGHLVDVLGEPGENETEMHAILAEFNLPYRFEKEVEDAANSIKRNISPEDIKNRKDFREVFTFTIDPADAKDFDDALSYRKLSNGNFEVGVHIADVSHYVTEGSPIDKEARYRGTSVYLVDRTVPMLPETLCNELCSLAPGADKLTFSAVFEMSPNAKVVRSWLGRTIIRSDKRLDYDQAQALIKEPADDLLGEAITNLNSLAAILKQNRRNAGAIDFERPEMKVLCDEKGKPVEIYRKESQESNFLIEEFMLLANRTVAGFVSGKGKTFVYRIHDNPNPEKLEGLRGFAKSFGYKMEGDLQGREAARGISALLKQSEGKPEYAAFQDIALRSMAKAKYSTDNIGHYGLAFSDYTHFTSPIRRYPDLMVHRLLALYLDGGKSQDKDWLESECMYASEREQVATDAERTSVKYKLVEYMQSHVGEELTGHISGVTEWGIYVEIEPTHIEGMVALREIKGDFFEYDEKRYRVVGRRTRKVYKLGDELRIKVARANLEQRILDFELVQPELENENA